jgi:hypothetical protein
MSEHRRVNEVLPFYASGSLAGDRRREVENHLPACAECRADLELWAGVSKEIETSGVAVKAPSALAEQALKRVRGGTRGWTRTRGLPRTGLALACLRTGQLLRAQASLVQGEIWPASAAVMALGVAVALVSNHVEAVYFLAPLVAAGSLTLLYGPANDPAYELVAATPTSPWKVLLARLSLVFGYNLLLSLAAALALLVAVPPELLGTLILGWLSPMAFLSALALLLSLWIGTSNAIAITYTLWIAQVVPYKAIGLWIAPLAWEPVFLSYREFWHNPLLLGSLAVVLVGIALWSTGRPVFRLSPGID